MNINDAKQSKYLSKDDVGNQGWQLTLQSVQMQVVDDETGESRAVATFAEPVKPAILNITNLQLLAHWFGSEETDHWIGRQIVVYNDPTVQFAGKMTGGIRVRVPQSELQRNPAPQPPPAQNFPPPPPPHAAGNRSARTVYTGHAAARAVIQNARDAFIQDGTTAFEQSADQTGQDFAPDPDLRRHSVLVAVGGLR